MDFTESKLLETAMLLCYQAENEKPKNRNLFHFLKRKKEDR